MRGNKEEKLIYYINSDADKLIEDGDKGIASWSKVLSIRDPSKYAIYDARVALALNSIQKVANIRSAALFPQLPSRNTTFVLPTQKKINESKYFSTTQSKFYETYLKLLKGASSGGPWDIQDIEMILFCCAEKLSKVWKS